MGPRETSAIELLQKWGARYVAPRGQWELLLIDTTVEIMQFMAGGRADGTRSSDGRPEGRGAVEWLESRGMRWGNKIVGWQMPTQFAPSATVPPLSTEGAPLETVQDIVREVRIDGPVDLSKDTGHGEFFRGTVHQIDGTGESAYHMLPGEVVYPMNVEGYNCLAEVLHRAYHQAATGKGHERHANGEPFDEQVMADMARRFGVGSLLGQAFKKSEESQRLEHDRAIKELLGAINYLAGAVIHMEKKAKNVPF